MSNVRAVAVGFQNTRTRVEDQVVVCRKLSAGISSRSSRSSSKEPVAIGSRRARMQRAVGSDIIVAGRRDGHQNDVVSYLLLLVGTKGAWESRLEQHLLGKELPVAVADYGAHSPHRDYSCRP